VYFVSNEHNTFLPFPFMFLCFTFIFCSSICHWGHVQCFNRITLYYAMNNMDMRNVDP
jgi:hypothetical protein